MKITFQKHPGNPALHIAFFWRLQIAGAGEEPLDDSFIPELFYDFFWVQQGNVQWAEGETAVFHPVPSQTLKTLHTHRLTLRLELPLTMWGVRFLLPFAERWGSGRLPANRLLAVNWVATPPNGLANFAKQVMTAVERERGRETAVSLLNPTTAQADKLAHYSGRHRRRLYKNTFGLSQKEMQIIANVHAFLGQNCDFSNDNPRIIEYVNDERFYDQPHLNRAFKKVVGLSPLDYFQTPAILQDNLMAVSYNEPPSASATMAP